MHRCYSDCKSSDVIRDLPNTERPAMSIHATVEHVTPSRPLGFVIAQLWKDTHLNVFIYVDADWTVKQSGLYNWVNVSHLYNEDQTVGEILDDIENYFTPWLDINSTP